MARIKYGRQEYEVELLPQETLGGRTAALLGLELSSLVFVGARGRRFPGTDPAAEEAACQQGMLLQASTRAGLPG